MRTRTRTTLPTEPLESALGTARDTALLVKTKGLELLDSDAAHELLHKGQHVAVVAKHRANDLLDSDVAHELGRRSRNVVLAAKGDLVAVPKRSRRGVGVLLFAVGAAAGVAAAIVSKKMATPLPDPISPSYDDPAAQFPTKDGVIDLTSVAVEEGVTETPVEDMTAMGDAEIGSSTDATLATAGTTSTAGSTNGRASRTPKPKTEGSSGGTGSTSTS